MESQAGKETQPPLFITLQARNYRLFRHCEPFCQRISVYRYEYSGKTVWQSAFGPCSAILEQGALRFDTREIASQARDDKLEEQDPSLRSG
jgi:hypothetical protein